MRKKGNLAVGEVCSKKERKKGRNLGREGRYLWLALALE
jgi:hypothetical protein